MKSFFLSFFLFVWCASATQADFVVVIDPGHGGLKGEGRVDPESHEALERKARSYGASWNNATSDSGILEKTLTLEYSKEILKAFQESARANEMVIKARLTRGKDEHLSAISRAARAVQAKADVFVSIHFNSYKTLWEDENGDYKGDPKFGEVFQNHTIVKNKKPVTGPVYYAQGARAYYSSKFHPESKYLSIVNPYHSQDKKFASDLAKRIGKSIEPFMKSDSYKPNHKAMGDASERYPDGIRLLGYARQDPSMYRCVVALLEVEFISSPTVEEGLLLENRDSARRAVAKEFVEVICDHLESYTPPGKPLLVPKP